MIAGYNRISIHADHRAMTKFNDDNDPGYTSVRGTIHTWISIILQPNIIQSTSNTIAYDDTSTLLTWAEDGSCVGRQGLTVEPQSDADQSLGFITKDEAECIRSLTFAQMGTREVNIDKAATGTC